jgi:hypothetical protein
VTRPPPYVGGYLGYQASAHWIGQRVKAKSRESIPAAFFFAQHMIVRLMLPFATATQRRLQVRA